MGYNETVTKEQVLINEFRGSLVLQLLYVNELQYKEVNEQMLKML
jgi:hypothetical protein